MPVKDMETKINLFWFRRDLRLDDNPGLFAALTAGRPVLPVFVFDTAILGKLPDRDDARVRFIHQELMALKKELENAGSSLLTFYGSPMEAFAYFAHRFSPGAVYCNRDYEPYGQERDREVSASLKKQGIDFISFKDHVIFEPGEVLKDDGTPYTVFTPYSRKWKTRLTEDPPGHYPSAAGKEAFLKTSPFSFPDLPELGFTGGRRDYPSRSIDRELIGNYGQTRDFPGIAGSSRLGIHLRFGTISVRKVVEVADKYSQVFLNELIWREFFISILAHFPYVENGPFRKKYGLITWRNNEEEFGRWCRGETGYPMVDAGMRELRATGFMHNRVRMVTASFLAKHLLIDWRWGEAWFAAHLLDFELASNNGNWQWAAGCGCDAAPYFRVFNPAIQQQKFDAPGSYIRKWVPEAGTVGYARPMVDHALARERALKTYRGALE